MADKVPPSRAITEGLYILSFGFVSMYVLRAKSSLLAFDVGMKASSVTEELNRLGLNSSEVKNVFLTHTDMDHVGGLSVFPGAKVHLSALEVPMITRKKARFFGMIFNKALPTDYTVLSDREELNVDGATIQCISTPGHTSGSMSFLVNRKILIVGDELNLKNGIAVLDRKILGVDNNLRLESIKKLAAISGVSFLCTMHSGYTDSFEQAMRPWF